MLSLRCGGDIQLEVVWTLEYLILELKTEVWDKEHHLWECKIMRNEDAEQRAKNAIISGPNQGKWHKEEL